MAKYAFFWRSVDFFQIINHPKLSLRPRVQDKKFDLKVCVVGDLLRLQSVMHLFMCCTHLCHFFLSTSFLTTSRRLLHFSSPTESATGEPSEAASSPTSPRGLSSQSSSNLPSPVRALSRPGAHMWSLDTDLSSSRAATLSSAPSPSALQDTSSQDTQSSGKMTPHPLHGYKGILKWNIII